MLRSLPPGWLSETEALFLAELGKGRVVLEIGAYLGRSTVALATGAKLVVSVDHHRGDPGTKAGSKHPSEGWTLPAFTEALTRLNLWGKVVPVVTNSELAGQLLARTAFGVAFIDGAHDSVSVLRDTEVAIRLLAPGGVIAWHDWDYESVKAGANAVIDIAEVRQEPGTRIGTWTKGRPST